VPEVEVEVEGLVVGAFVGGVEGGFVAELPQYCGPFPQ